MLDTLIALVATVIMFSVIFSVPGMDEQVSGTGTVGMLFISLPQLFFTEVPFGSFLGPLFYVLVALAALTSTMSLLEVVAAYVIDEHHITRAKATLLCGGAVFAFTILAALSFGGSVAITEFHLGGALGQRLFGGKSSWFVMVDHFVSNWMLPTGGFAITIAAGWFLTREYTERELVDGDRARVVQLWGVAVLYPVRVASGRGGDHHRGAVLRGGLQLADKRGTQVRAPAGDRRGGSASVRRSSGWGRTRWDRLRVRQSAFIVPCPEGGSAPGDESRLPLFKKGIQPSFRVVFFAFPLQPGCQQARPAGEGRAEDGNDPPFECSLDEGPAEPDPPEQGEQPREDAQEADHGIFSRMAERGREYHFGGGNRSRHPAQIRSKLTRVAETQTRTLHRSGGSPSGSLDSRSADSGRCGGFGAAPAPACGGSPVVARGGPGRSCVPSCHEGMPLSLTEASLPGLPAGIDEM